MVCVLLPLSDYIIFELHLPEDRSEAHFKQIDGLALRGPCLSSTFRAQRNPLKSLADTVHLPSQAVRRPLDLETLTAKDFQ